MIHLSTATIIAALAFLTGYIACALLCVLLIRRDQRLSAQREAVANDKIALCADGRLEIGEMLSSIARMKRGIETWQRKEAL